MHVPGSLRAPPGPARASGARLLAAAIVASAMGFIDGSVTAIALPAIREALGASLAGAQWVTNAYLLALAALTLVGGALGDRFGTARVFGLGIAGFTAASLLCALAPATGVLVAARFLQGVAAALMVPGSLALIARSFPEGERGQAIGRWAAASALTTAAGPILGGLLLGLGPLGWRLVFLLNLPLGLLALWLLRPALAEDQARPGRGLDWVGATLATLGLGLLAAGLTRAEGSGGATLLTLVGLAILAAFAILEARLPRPMLPPRLFLDRGFGVANLATLLLYAGLSLVIFLLPMLLVAGWGMGELRASLAFVPLSVLIFLLSSRFGALADRVGPFALIATGSGVVAGAYLWLGLAVGAGSFAGGVLPPMTLAGLGMAMVVAPLSAAVMAGASEDGGIASGVNNAVSRVAGVLAVAGGGALAAAAYAAAGGPLSFGEPGAAPGHAEAMTAAFRQAAFAAAALAGGAAALSLLGTRGLRGARS